MQERQGDITEDETVRFKSYLMSLGIDDPVTRDAYKSSNEYFKQLAMQLTLILEEPIKVNPNVIVNDRQRKKKKVKQIQKTIIDV